MADGFLDEGDHGLQAVFLFGQVFGFAGQRIAQIISGLGL